MVIVKHFIIVLSVIMLIVIFLNVTALLHTATTEIHMFILAFKRHFSSLIPGPNVIKLFLPVINRFSL
jgi:hypothetical protein